MLTALTRLGGNKNYTACTSGSVNSGSRCILKDRYLLNAFRSHSLKTALDSVNQDKWLITTHKRCYAT